MFDALAALFCQSQSRPDDVAFSAGSESLTYAQLAGQVGAFSHRLDALSDDVIAIYAPNSLHWVVADLSLAFAGKTMVPLPTFFSDEQLRHIIKDAGVKHILATDETYKHAKAFVLPVSKIILNAAPMPLDAERDNSRNAERIIYTSGTSGAPKGVRLGDGQINASARGLLDASGATSQDRYLSVLPFSLLLEQIAAIAVPIMAGAHVTLEPDAAARATKGDGSALMNAFEDADATVSVLVPGLLNAWTKALSVAHKTAPKNLRFIAVGGAPVHPALAQSAWALGIPVHEGYGLSECCSVVSVNRIGNRIPNTVGRPIQGAYVTLKDGEIVVHGSTVMKGYLGHAQNPNGVWHTGDLGAFTDEGALRILGRKDNLIVTQGGRNVSPEWVEGVCESLSSINKAVLCLVPQHGLILIVLAQQNFDDDDQAQLNETLTHLPDYATPDHITFITQADALQNGLFTPLGDVRRSVCHAFAVEYLSNRH